MSVKKYVTHEETDLISKKFARKYSNESVQDKNNTFIFNFQGAMGILTDKKCQTFPNHTHKGELTLIRDESKIEEIVKNIYLRGFELKNN